MTSQLLAKREETLRVGRRSSLRFQLDLEPRAKIETELGRVRFVWMALIHSFRSSPWRTLWLLRKWGEEKSSCHGGAASASMRGGVAGRSAERERRLELYLRRGGDEWEWGSNPPWGGGARGPELLR